ncbi:MAG: hypothetical protein K2Q14_06320 [Gammaproteobacteria bacterium]|nr:hypothetical protein [Gammaproteobacteria bacterium]
MLNTIEAPKVDPKKQAILLEPATFQLIDPAKLFIVPICIGLMYHRNNGDFPAIFNAIMKLNPQKIRIILVDTLQKYNHMDYDAENAQRLAEIREECKQKGKDWLQLYQPMFEYYENIVEIAYWDQCLEPDDFRLHLRNIQALYWSDSFFQSAVQNSTAPGLNRLARQAKENSDIGNYIMELLPKSLNSISYVLEESAAIFTWSGYLVNPTDLNPAMKYLLNNYPRILKDPLSLIPHKNISLPESLLIPLVAQIKTLSKVIISKDTFFSSSSTKKIRSRSLPPESKTFPNSELIDSWIKTVVDTSMFHIHRYPSNKSNMITDLIGAIREKNNASIDKILQKIVTSAIEDAEKLIRLFNRDDFSYDQLIEKLAVKLGDALVSATQISGKPPLPPFKRSTSTNLEPLLLSTIMMEDCQPGQSTCFS